MRRTGTCLTLGEFWLLLSSVLGPVLRQVHCSVSCPEHSRCLGLPGLSSPSSHLRKLSRVFPGFLSLCHCLETLFKKKAGATIGLTSFLSCLSGITILCHLVPNVFRTYFLIFCPVFNLFQGRGKAWLQLVHLYQKQKYLHWILNI